MIQFTVQKVQGGYILHNHSYSASDSAVNLGQDNTEVFTSEAKLLKKIRELLGDVTVTTAPATLLTE